MKLETLESLLRTLDTPTHELTVDYASLVRRINLTNLPSAVDDSILLQMRACTKLERLTIGGCSKLTDLSLVPLLQNNHEILSIDMTNLENLSDNTLITLAQNCPKLQGLYASGCKHFTDDSINALAANCPYLKRMKLSGCHLLTDSAIRNLIASCPLLVELDLTGCWFMLDETAQLAFTNLPQLREYRLSLNVNITDHTILGLPLKASYDKLRIMDLSGCLLVTDEGIGRLVSVAPRLRNVVLAKCYNITDRGLGHLAKLGRNLHYVHLGHCNNITNVGVTTLVRACNRIQYIDVACCNQLQDQAVKEIAQLPKLRRVGLVKCQSISDMGIHAFTQRGSQENTLERIHLSYCSNITVNAITSLVNSCPRLTHLSLTGIAAFMREDLLRFCREPPPEFTQHQQQVFCVFSGQGVRKLRDQLNIIASERRFQHQRMVEQYMAGHLETHQILAAAANATVQAFLPDIADNVTTGDAAPQRTQQQGQQQQQQQQQPRVYMPNFYRIFDIPEPDIHFQPQGPVQPNPALENINHDQLPLPIPIPAFHIQARPANHPPNYGELAEERIAIDPIHLAHLRHLRILQEQQHQLALQASARGNGFPNTEIRVQFQHADVNGNPIHFTHHVSNNIAIPTDGVRVQQTVVSEGTNIAEGAQASGSARQYSVSFPTNAIAGVSPSPPSRSANTEYNM